MNICEPFVLQGHLELKKRTKRDLQYSRKKKGSISVSGQLPTDPSPNPTLTLTCYQLTVVGLGEG